MDRPEPPDRNDEGDQPEDTERQVIGQPERLGPYWEKQVGANDCIPTSETCALRGAGMNANVEEARQYGEQLGVYKPDEGTYMSAQGYVWEQHGLQVDRPEFNNADEAFNRMSQDLDEGKGVVVTVETGPLWDNPGGRHALWITGMETDGDGNVTNVICNDTDRDDGRECRYPRDKFEEAWDLTNYKMVSTRERLYS
jgi:hypothetical protein